MVKIKKMNKLKANLFTKKEWGSEIIWALTDNYMAKTVEVAPGKSSPLVVHERKEKSLIVIKGPLFLVYGKFAEEELSEAYKLPDGWSWTIEPGYVYKYMAFRDPVILIEVATSDLDDGHILMDDEYLEFSEEDAIRPPIVK